MPMPWAMRSHDLSLMKREGEAEVQLQSSDEPQPWKLRGWVPKHILFCSRGWFWMHQNPGQAWILGRSNQRYGFNSFQEKELHLQDIISAQSRTLLSALCNTMKPELTYFFLLLLIFSMPLHTLSGVLLPPKLRKQLCESGHLGGKAQ